MKILFILSLTLALSVEAFGAIALFQESNGKIEILARGNPSALKIKGQGSGPSGKIDLSTKEVSGELEFNLNSLDTGIKLRNEHMKNKYLQTETYPKAKLKITRLDLQGNDPNKDFKLTGTNFDGTLSLHGVEKSVSGNANITKTNSNAKVSADFKINIKDYGIDIPSFAGITVTEEVSVNVDSETTIQ